MIGKKNETRKLSVANTRYFIAAKDAAYGEPCTADSFEHGAIGIEDCCRRVKTDILDKRHRDVEGLAAAMAAAWTDIAKEDTSGLSGLAHQGAYFKGVAGAMGLDLDADGIRHSMPGNRWALENTIKRCMTVADPEIASAYLKYLGDGKDRDGFGRELAENGRPVGFERMTPGVFLSELNKDNERIMAKREQALYPDVQPEPEAGRAAVKPEKKGAFARLKSMLMLHDDEADGPEDSAEEPGL